VNSRRGWLVFGVAAFAYLVAVLQRSSLGIAGVDATERFDVQAAALSSLAVVQLIVYAGLQIPVGVVLDRVGPKLLIASGALLMVVGQATLAIAPTIGVAIVGRILVGAGDAMTFISVSRLIAAWFRGRTLPLMSQALGTLGQLGQVLSAIPLSIVLHQFGWSAAYLSVAAVSVVAFVLVLLFISNVPTTGDLPTGAIVLDRAGGWPVALKHLRDSLARPGTQLGFWSHFVTQSWGTVLTLLWGFPFFSVALGYGPATASLLLTLIVATAAVSGPVLGLLSARYPYRRSNIVLGIVSAMAVAWGAVILWPGQPPLWVVITMIVVVAIGGPGSMIGFDFARTFNPARSLGSATGVVNVGGFLASFTMMFVIGLVLDAIDVARGGTGVPAELYSLESFRIAFLVPFPIVGVGVTMLLLARRKTRRRMHEDEGITVAPLWVSLVRGWRRGRSAS
jgi:sugar phosphate permease